MWIVKEDGRESVTCATVDDARQYVEDRAVEVWQAGRDPNARGPQLHPGVTWEWTTIGWVGSCCGQQWTMGVCDE